MKVEVKTKRKKYINREKRKKVATLNSQPPSCDQYAWRVRRTTLLLSILTRRPLFSISLEDFRREKPKP